MSRKLTECVGKVAHPSYKVAVTNLNRVRGGMDRAGRDRKECGRFHVYRCRYCAMYHIGNSDWLGIEMNKGK